MLATSLLSLHTALELVAGSLLIVRGKGSLEANTTPSAKAKLYRRWHGAGLLALSGLGALVLARGQSHGEVGRTAFIVLTGFHSVAFGVHLLAAVEGESDLTVSFKEALLSPHLVLAAGMAVHLAR